MLKTTLIFVAGGVAGALALPYLKRAASNLLVGVIESVEKSQQELEHIEKVKAETEAERTIAQSARAEAQDLRNEAQRLHEEIRRMTDQRLSRSIS